MSIFDGKHALVTGAGRGIGRAVAQQLARKGAHVVVSDRDLLAAETVTAEIRRFGGSAEAVACDVTSKAQVQAAVAQSSAPGYLDLLVSNVGVALEASFDTMTEQEWDLQIRATLTGAFLLCQAASQPLIQAPEGGRAVLVGSVNGLRAYGHEAYSAAKAGLANLTQNLALRLGGQGVRVNMVAPGTIVTEAWTDRLQHDPGLLNRLARHYPGGTLGRPDDVAHAISFLLSDEAAWINGVVLPVDGGLTAGSVALLEDREVRPVEGSA
jgi:NAD(P)-dependent dehydrogenase (short-subunit alcohol dehydrogenase family)